MSELDQRIKEKIERELSPLVCNLFKDPKVVDIMLNPDGKLWVDRIGQDMEHIGNIKPAQAEALISTIASFYKTTVTRQNPILECELPFNGSRFEAWLPPVVSSPTFTIRCKPAFIFTLDDYVNQGTMTIEQANIIRKAVAERKNILVVGGTGSGKTTLTNAIIEAIAKLYPNHRIFILEDTNEIQCSALNVVVLRATKDVTLLVLLKSTLRGRPDRIIVGEVRGGEETLSLLKAWNTGHPGGACTIHADSALLGLLRLEQLISEVSQSSSIKSLIASTVDLVVFIEKDETIGSGRKVKEILTVGLDASGSNYILGELNKC